MGVIFRTHKYINRASFEVGQGTTNFVKITVNFNKSESEIKSLSKRNVSNKMSRDLKT